jgi:hypothetical protein
LQKIELEIWYRHFQFKESYIIFRSIISDEIFMKICGIVKQFQHCKEIRLSFNRYYAN